MNMKPWICILLFGLLAGCGSAGAGESMPPGPAGIHLDSTLEEHLKTAFAEVKACGGFGKGEFSDLSIVMMPPSYPCPMKNDICSADFMPPNFIHLGVVGLWRHEVIHYLLHLNDGDSDPNHQHPFFFECENPPTGSAVIS